MPLSAPNTVFIDISGDTKLLVHTLNLATCPTQTEILGSFVIPSIVNTTNQSLRDSFVKFALNCFHNLSRESKEMLAKTEIVPITVTETIYKCPADMVDVNLAEFFFPDEYRIPDLLFYKHHYSILRELGMALKVDHKLVLERIEAYSQPKRSLEEVGKKAQKLMELYIPNMSLPAKHLSYRWIPATTSEGKGGLFSAGECRDSSFRLLVNYAMPLTEFRAPDAWKTALGWNRPLSKPEILRQLEGARDANDNIALRHLILKGGENLAQCKSEFEEWEWIPSMSGVYYRPSDIFLNNFPLLSPYLGTLSPDFKIDERCVNFLEQLGVDKVPDFCQVFLNSFPQPHKIHAV